LLRQQKGLRGDREKKVAKKKAAVKKSTSTKSVKARKAAPPKPRLVVENDGKEVALKKKTGAKTTQAKPKRQNKDSVEKKQENQIKLF
jgi:hypothetical protein